MTSPAVSYDEAPYYPDEVQVPEARAHRSMAVLLKAAIGRALGPSSYVDGNLNWYPSDGGEAVAPDAMVLPADLIPANATSYLQRATGGPTPVAVVEIPSKSDDFPTFLTKLHRLQRLGTVVYVVNVPSGEPEVFRLGLTDEAMRPWLGQSCIELGGIIFQVRDHKIVIWMPDGIVAADIEELHGALAARAEEATQRAHRAEAELATLQQRL